MRRERLHRALRRALAVIHGLALVVPAPLLVAEPPVQVKPPITAAAFAPGGEQVVVGSQAGLSRRDWPSLQAREPIETRLANIHDLAFAPSGDRLAVVGGRPGESGELEVFTWPAGSLVLRRRLADDLLYTVVWSPEGARILAGGAPHALVELSLESDSLRSLEGHSGPVVGAAYLGPAARQTIVSASGDGTLRTWHAADGRPVRTLSQHAGAVRSLAVRPGAQAPAWIASSGSDRTVRFWQPTIGRQVRFARLPSEALTIDWSSDGKLLLAAGVDGRLRAIDPETVAIVDEWPVLDGWAYVVRARPTPAAQPVTAPAATEKALVAGEGGDIQAVDYRLRGSGRAAP